MMLDSTGSMGGQKIVDLKAAATDLLEIVVADNQAGAYSKVGIAPFSNSVGLDNQLFNQATGKTVGGGRRITPAVSWSARRLTHIPTAPQHLGVLSRR